MLRPRRGRKLTSQCSRAGSPRPGDPAPGLTLTTERGRRRLPTDGRSSRIHPASPGRPCGRSGHCSTTAHDEDQVEADPPLAQHGLRQPQAPRSTSSRRAVVDTPGDHAARPSQLHDCLPHCHAPRAFRSDTADAGSTDTGRPHRTPEAGHWTPGRSDTAPDTDQLDSHSWDTGRSHRTPMRTGRPPRRATAYWNAQPCSCSRTTRQLLGRSVGQAAPWRTALLRRISGRA
jgi:hypothetical protein